MVEVTDAAHEAMPSMHNRGVTERSADIMLKQIGYIV